eukprot:2285373-Pyramimonas_sp.AAC.1
MDVAPKWQAHPGSPISLDFIRVAVRPRARRLNQHRRFLFRTSAMHGHWARGCARLNGRQTRGLAWLKRAESPKSLQLSPAMALTIQMSEPSCHGCLTSLDADIPD